MTTICGIIGFPVKHSLSPAMHNAGYAKLGLDFEYLAWEFKNVATAIKQMREQNIRGYSVTIPHKVMVMDFLDEIDEVAKNIGAVNTVVNDGGVLKGYNTDWLGCMKAIEDELKIKGKKALVVGAGGAARAVAFGLKEKGCGELVVLNRTVEKAEVLAKIVGADQFGKLDDLDLYRSAEIVVNTTSVGMEPNVDQSPVPAEAITQGMLVHDIVYKPRETKLIQDAKARGAAVVTGEKMLLYQGVVQFELFTGESAPVEEMAEALNQKLYA